MQNKNLYTVLGINNKAGLKEIKSAYRSLAKQFHPDKNPGNKIAEEHFKEVQYAYTVLSNIEKRRKYDLKSANTYSQHKHQSRYNGNAYQYAQEQAKQTASEYDSYEAPIPSLSKQYKTEIIQIVISTIIALILLYFIVSY